VRYVLGRLEGGTDEIDAADDDESRGGGAAGQVAPPVLVGEHMGVMEENHEAEEHHAEHAQ